MTKNKKRKMEHVSDTDSHSERKNKQTEEARIDPTYGQRSAIPGLDSGAYLDGDDDLNYDVDMDALSYLRSVRQEATSIPNLLVAPKDPTQQHGEPDRAIYNNGVGDHRGWYEGGAYVAAPEPQTDEYTRVDGDESQEQTRDPQLAYFDSILTRFKALRDQLSRTPPPEIVQSLDTNHPTYLPTNSSKEVFGKWSWVLKNVEPVPSQLSSINKGTAFRLLGMLTKGAMLKRGCDVSGCVSRWLWGLLAKVPEAGELTNVEVSIIRELGKKAVLVGVGFKEAREWNAGMDEVEADFEEGEDQQVEYEVVNKDEVPLDEDEEDIEIHNTSTTKEQPSGSSLHRESDSINSIAEPGAMPDHPEEAIKQANANTGIENPNQQKLDGGLESRDKSAVDISPEDFAAAKARILARISEASEEDTPTMLQKQQEADPVAESSPTLNTRATVDMIITVAGELYGQRDLLEFREMWGEDA